MRHSVYLFYYRQVRTSEDKMKRKMTMAYSTDTKFVYSSDKQKPMIRIANFFLLKSGFKVGDKVEVEYQDNQLIIRKINLSK